MSVVVRSCPWQSMSEPTYIKYIYSPSGQTPIILLLGALQLYVTVVYTGLLRAAPSLRDSIILKRPKMAP